MINLDFINLKKYYIYNIVLLCCLYQQSAFANSYHYTVSVAPTLKRVTIKLCFKSVIHDKNIKLIAHNDLASSQISNIKLQHGNNFKKIKLLNNSINLTKLTKNDCLHYQSDLIFSTGHKISGISHHQQIITDPNHWLWYPELITSLDNIQLRLTHPQEMNISAPWILLNRTKSETIYQIRKRPSEWDSLVAFGKFKVKDVITENATIRYALLNGYKKVDQNKIYTWLDTNIKALSTVYNKFPVKDLQILIIPLGKGYEPVPWGQVVRGGGDAVHLYIDDTRSKQEFMDDWVLSHELSHLLLPRITGDGAWLSEGLASYYQNVIRARQGLLTPRLAWAELHAGFERGISRTPTNRNLDEVTRSMMTNHNYMRVYWSGAALSLLADVKLRRLSSNRKSLDEALYQLQKCCLLNPRWWTAREIMSKLDELTKTSVFSDILTENMYSTKFPDLKQVYKLLGFEKQNNKLIILDNPPSSIRNKIMMLH